MSSPSGNPLQGMPDCPPSQQQSPAQQPNLVSPANPAPSAALPPIGSPGAPASSPVSGTPSGALPNPGTAGAPPASSSAPAQPTIQSNPLVPSSWQPQATAATAAGFPQLGAAMAGLSTVMGNLNTFLSSHLSTTNTCNCNCSGVVQGQIARTCDQCEQVLMSKLDKIANLLMTLIGECAGRLASVVPPVGLSGGTGPGPIGGAAGTPAGGPGQPINAPVFPPGAINAPLFPPGGQTGVVGTPITQPQGAGQIQGQQPGSPGYTPYNPPQQGGMLQGQTPVPPPQLGLTGQPGGFGSPQFPTQPSLGGSTTTSGPTGPTVTAQPGQPIQIPSGGGPCTIMVSCIDIAVASAIGNAIANAVGNMLRPMFPNLALSIPPMPTSTQSQQPTKWVKYKAPFQFTSGPTIYTDSLDSWFEPDDDADIGEIEGEGEGEIL